MDIDFRFYNLTITSVEISHAVMWIRKEFNSSIEDNAVYEIYCDEFGFDDTEYQKNQTEYILDYMEFLDIHETWQKLPVRVKSAYNYIRSREVAGMFPSITDFALYLSMNNKINSNI